MPKFDVVLEVPFNLRLKGVEADDAAAAAREAEETFLAASKQFDQPGIQFAGDLVTVAKVKPEGATGHYLWLDRQLDGTWAETT